MPGLLLDRMPHPARTAWAALRDELVRILDDDLVAMWGHGGTTAIEDLPHPGDVDTCVLLARRPDEATIRQIDAALDAIARDLGVEWDTWFVLEADARGSAPPRHAFREGRRDTSWAIHRAHWLAGRYVTLHGPEPYEIVTAPEWTELQGELDRELEHMERHVVEGDTDPFEATYAVLNGSRILHALETGSVVTSKRAAGTWGLDHLPARWHPVLRAAIRTYDGAPSADDADLLAAEMAPFLSFVRERLPATGRPADEPPRWSGY